MPTPAVTLRGQLVGAGLALTAGAFALCLGIGLAQARRLTEQRQRDVQEQAVRRLMEVAVNAAEQNNDFWVVRHMKDTVGSPAVLYVAVTDADNRIRLHTDLLRGDSALLGQAWRTLREDQRHTIRATDLKAGGVDVREWSGPVPQKGRWHGMAYIGYDRAALAREVAAERRRALLAFGLGTIPTGALAVFLAGALSGRVRRRLGELGEVARRLSDGEMDHRAPVGADELGELAAGLNAMAGRLQAAHDAQGESLASIAHDLKAPLSNILAFTQLLREQGKERLSTEDQDCLSSIVSIVHRMSIMVQEILDLARLKAGQVVMRKSPSAVGDLAREALKVIEPTARDLGVRVAVDVPADVPPVLVDPLLVVRVLVNLLANALRFTPKGGRVGVNAAFRNERVEVLVADNGTGIPPERLPTLFTRFQQVPEAMGEARRAVGSGLGLAVCKAIVDAHGGEIWVRSPDGGGTVIGFALPIR